MYPKGIVYQSGDAKRGERILRASLLVRTAFGLLRGVGAGLVAFVVISLIFTYGPVAREEIGYALRGPQTQTTSGFSDLIQRAEAQTTAQVQAEAASYGVDSYFSIVIPKLGASSNVIANVDTTEKTSYLDALQKGVAHAKGTNFPGQEKRIFLFSHSTDSPLSFAKYNAVFYLLRKLETGDRIIIFFADKKYEYEMVERIVTNPADVSWLTADTDGEDLVLQTCDPPGTTWNRLLVIARPVNH